MRRLTVSSRASSSNDAGTVSTTVCCSSRAASSVRARARGSRRRAGARAAAPRPRPATARGRLGCPTAAAPPCDRRADWTSQDLADAICRAGHQRALVAREHAGDDVRRPGPTAGATAPAVALRLLGEVEEGRQRAVRARSRRRRRAAASSKMRMAPRASAQASAELVVPRSMPTMKRGAGLVVRARAPGCSTRASSAGCRRARRTTARACRPRSRGSRASPARDVVLRPSTCSVTSSGLSSSRSSPQSSISVPAAIALAHRGAEEPELGRLADDRGRTRGRRSSRWCLPPCRTARRTAP